MSNTEYLRYSLIRAINHLETLEVLGNFYALKRAQGRMIAEILEHAKPELRELIWEEQFKEHGGYFQEDQSIDGDHYEYLIDVVVLDHDQFNGKSKKYSLIQYSNENAIQVLGHFNSLEEAQEDMLKNATQHLDPEEKDRVLRDQFHEKDGSIRSEETINGFHYDYLINDLNRKVIL